MITVENLTKRYGGFTAKHFHDKLRQHHGFTLSYTWTKLRLQAAGLVPKAPRRSAHRKRRPRRPLPGGVFCTWGAFGSALLCTMRMSTG